jgi:hypothetical protein
MAANNTTWTDADAQAWAALQAKQQASIKTALVPVAAALAGLDSITAALTSARTALATLPSTTTDLTSAAQRIDRLLNVLSVDGAAVIAAASDGGANA